MLKGALHAMNVGRMDVTVDRDIGGLMFEASDLGSKTFGIGKTSRRERLWSGGRRL